MVMIIKKNDEARREKSEKGDLGDQGDRVAQGLIKIVRPCQHG
jgi:hypothetical protein